MVCGYSGAPFTNWIYLFHMALFFMRRDIYGMSAMQRRKSVVQYMKRKVKSLWLPYIN